MGEAPRTFRPLLLVKRGTISRADIRRAERLAGVCIAQSSDLSSARFLDLPPSASADHRAAAALTVIRAIHRKDKALGYLSDRQKILDALLDALMATSEPIERIAPEPADG